MHGMAELPSTANNPLKSNINQAAGNWTKASQQFAKLIIWCVAAILCLILEV